MCDVKNSDQLKILCQSNMAIDHRVEFRLFHLKSNICKRSGKQQEQAQVFSERLRR